MKKFIGIIIFILTANTTSFAEIRHIPPFETVGGWTMTGCTAKKDEEGFYKTQVSLKKKTETRIIPQKETALPVKSKIVEYEKKNHIQFMPGVFFAYSGGRNALVAIPALGIGYLRETLPNFSVGPWIMYGHAFYDTKKLNTFNMIGTGIIFDLKF